MSYLLKHSLFADWRLYLFLLTTAISTNMTVQIITTFKRAITHTIIGLMFYLFISPCYALQPLRVGTDYFYPPYVISGEQFTGFDVDFMREVCRIIKRKCVFVPMQFSQLFDAINQRKIDVAIDAITITPQRKKYYLFSYPYMLSLGGFIVKDDSPITSISQILGKKVGVVSGTLYSDYLQKNYGTSVTLLEYKHVDNLIDALREGKVDIAFIDLFAGNYWKVNSSQKIRRVGKGVSIGAGLGIMTYKGNDALIAAINKAILDIENSGRFTSLYNQYLGL